MFKHPATSRLIHKSQYFISLFLFWLFFFFILAQCLLLDFISHQIFYSVCLTMYFFFCLFISCDFGFILCLFDFSYVSLITNHSINLFLFHQNVPSVYCFNKYNTEQYNSIIILSMFDVSYLFIYLT